MSRNFSANQYQSAFEPKPLRNWQIPANFKENPDHINGFTQIIADDRGHIKNENLKSIKNPWGNYIPNWDMPKKFPGPNNWVKVSQFADPKGLITTARSKHGIDRLTNSANRAQVVFDGSAKNETRINYKNQRIVTNNKPVYCQNEKSNNTDKNNLKEIINTNTQGNNVVVKSPPLQSNNIVNEEYKPAPVKTNKVTIKENNDDCIGSPNRLSPATRVMRPPSAEILCQNL